MKHSSFKFHLKRLFCNSRVLLSLSIIAMLAALMTANALAGGSLVVGANGQPLLWARATVQGGQLNTQTVDAEGRVLYRVDSGTLGSLSNEKAVALVDRIFNEYSAIPTSTLRFVNAGAIRNPNTGVVMDVNGSNIGLVYNSTGGSFQNPIVFDSDGGITGGGGVLGFFDFIRVDTESNTLREGIVVLNGAAISRVGEIPFLGVFTHEFGHFAGPLDHAQINGDIAANGVNSVQPADYTRAQAFDLFVPFTETLYPFLFSATTRAPGSVLAASGFASSGFFVASLDFDTTTALSNLYPTPEYLASTGSIEGRVLIKAGDAEIPVTGINVVARRISRGAYPPAVDTTAFTGFPTAAVPLDGDSVPMSPPAQDSTDSLATAASAVTGLQFGSGRYKISGLADGEYMVLLQRLNDSAVGGSGIGPLGNQIPIPVSEEYYNGVNNTSNSVSVFTPVTVRAGNTTSGIDLLINGLNLGNFTSIGETEPNNKIRQAPVVNPPLEIVGRVAGNDASNFRITNLPGATVDPIEDFYKFTVTASKLYFIILEPVDNAGGDLDMYLFNAATVGKKKASVTDSSVVMGKSNGPTANEFLAITLAPGTYTIGISAFENSSLGYKLRVIAAQ
ncbi:MAG: pre-peptidase C-terminal domain-containing protein [Acidobacteriota bacterium]